MNVFVCFWVVNEKRFFFLICLIIKKKECFQNSIDTGFHLVKQGERESFGEVRAAISSLDGPLGQDASKDDDAETTGKKECDDSHHILEGVSEALVLRLAGLCRTVAGPRLVVDRHGRRRWHVGGGFGIPLAHRLVWLV